MSRQFSDKKKARRYRNKSPASLLLWRPTPIAPDQEPETARSLPVAVLSRECFLPLSRNRKMRVIVAE
jgi:hypothetical protein